MMDHHSIDLGGDGPSVASRGAIGGNITRTASWRTLIRGARNLADRGLPGAHALNALRPMADSPNAAIAANATLRKDEWIQFDEAVVAAYQETLNGMSDMLGAGLRYPIGNPFGTPVVEWEVQSEMTAAHVSMYAGSPPEDDRVDYTLKGVPVPVISKGFSLDERVLEASRARGASLDTTNADAATRVVSEALENLLFLGDVSYGGYTLKGLTNAANINTGSLTGSWLTIAATNPGAIVSDVISMKTACMNDYAAGPYMIYIPHAWIDALDNPFFSTTAASPAAVTGMVHSPQTIRERILSLDRIQGIRSTSQLTASVCLVSMNRNVVDIPFGFEPRLIQWESQGGMVNHFRVISIMSVRVKSDTSGRSGIAYFS